MWMVKDHTVCALTIRDLCGSSSAALVNTTKASRLTLVTSVAVFTRPPLEYQMLSIKGIRSLHTVLRFIQLIGTKSTCSSAEAIRWL